jgi:hypothetical protein
MPGEKKIPTKKKLKEFIKLYEDYPKNLVRSKLNLTELQFDKLLRRALKEKIISHKDLIDLKEKDSLSVRFQNTPFSENEDDYGTLNKKRFFTKEGVISFDGNKPIEPRTSLLKGVIEWYKEAMTANNQFLLKISHENFIKYEN